MSDDLTFLLHVLFWATKMGHCQDRQDFLRGRSQRSTRGYNLASWEIVCKPKSQDGGGYQVHEHIPIMEVVVDAGKQQRWIVIQANDDEVWSKGPWNSKPRNSSILSPFWRGL